MGARAEAVEETRRAIVAAARVLHAERGLVATSWEDIAAKAGVSPATVYRHFPSLHELVPACARTVFDIIKPPTVEEAARTFASLDRASDRFERLVRYSAACYEAGADWLHCAHRERDFVPELDRALRIIEDTLHALVTAAAGRRLERDDHRVLFVLNDFPAWWSITCAGIKPARAADLIVRLVRAEVQRIGLDSKE